MFKGYDATQKYQKWQTITKKLNQFLLLIFAGLAGIGGSGLLLIEILKNWKWAGTIEIETFLFVFVTGICTGTIILLIAKEVLSRKDNK